MNKEVKELLQYILDQWELNTKDIQDRVLKLLKDEKN